MTYQEGKKPTDSHQPDISDGTWQAAVMVVKPTTFEIPTFDGTDSWELYHKQFEAAAAHNQWNDAEKAVALTVQLQGPEQQVFVPLPQSDTIEYATLVNCLEERFGQKHLAPMKKRELKNCIQTSGEGLQDYVAQILRLAQEAYTSVNPKFMGSAAVDNFMDGIWDWEVQ